MIAKSRGLGRSLVLLGLIAVSRGANAQERAEKPYVLKDVVALLQSRVRAPRVLQLVSKNCLAFRISSENEKLLENAGADAVLIAALRSVCVSTSADPSAEALSAAIRDQPRQGAEAQPQTAVTSVWAPRPSVVASSAYAPGSLPLGNDSRWSDAALEAGGLGPSEWRWVPPGEFDMGSRDSENNESHVHRVRLTQGFWVQKTEVTQGQWQAVMGTNPSRFSACGPRCPVEQVSWTDAQRFIAALNGRVTGGGFRLLTEAEWEWAARAGGSAMVSAGERDAQAWYDANRGGRTHEKSTHEACTKAANAWGLCDMLGNVWEWVQDDWVTPYPAGKVTDPIGSSSEDGTPMHVIRGGSWWNYATRVRPTSRDPGPLEWREPYLGFRLARTSQH